MKVIGFFVYKCTKSSQNADICNVDEIVLDILNYINDISNYNRGRCGSSIRIRSHLEDKQTTENMHFHEF